MSLQKFWKNPSKFFEKNPEKFLRKSRRVVHLLNIRGLWENHPGLSKNRSGFRDSPLEFWVNNPEFCDNYLGFWVYPLDFCENPLLMGANSCNKLSGIMEEAVGMMRETFEEESFENLVLATVFSNSWR